MDMKLLQELGDAIKQVLEAHPDVPPQEGATKEQVTAQHLAQFNQEDLQATEAGKLAEYHGRKGASRLAKCLKEWAQVKRASAAGGRQHVAHPSYQAWLLEAED